MVHENHSLQLLNLIIKCKNYTHQAHEFNFSAIKTVSLKTPQMNSSGLPVKRFFVKLELIMDITLAHGNQNRMRDKRVNPPNIWRYIPAKIQTLVCNIVVLNYCSFSHSNIQLLQFNIAHSQFKVHISNATWLEHATF